jgi:hypothetical protein
VWGLQDDCLSSKAKLTDYMVALGATCILYTIYVRPIL